jgi:hypothetical protein
MVQTNAVSAATPGPGRFATGISLVESAPPQRMLSGAVLRCSFVKEVSSWRQLSGHGQVSCPTLS